VLMLALVKDRWVVFQNLYFILSFIRLLIQFLA